MTNEPFTGTSDFRDHFPQSQKIPLPFSYAASEILLDDAQKRWDDLAAKVAELKEACRLDTCFFCSKSHDVDLDCAD